MRARIAALTLACLLVTATAAMAQQPPNTTSGGRDANLPAAPNFGMALMSAVIAGDGTFVRGAGVTNAAHLVGDGAYEVVFDRNITLCTYVADVGDTAAGSATGLATVATRSENSSAVFIETFSFAGVAADEPFHLIVFCAK